MDQDRNKNPIRKERTSDILIDDITICCQNTEALQELEVEGTVFKKILLVFLFLFLLGANGMIGYNIYSHLTKDSHSASNLVRESKDIINIIAETTDSIRNGAPIRSKRGNMQTKDYEMILDYVNKYDLLLKEDIDPTEQGYTESEQALVNYVVGLFVTYGLMNEQFILGDSRFASSIMDGLYVDLEKAASIFWLLSENSLTMDHLNDPEMDFEIDEQENEEEIDTEETTTEAFTRASGHSADQQAEEHQVFNEDSPYALTIEQRKEMEYQVKTELGADFVYDPYKEYDTTGWNDSKIDALMAADTLYYDELGVPSPYN